MAEDDLFDADPDDEGGAVPIAGRRILQRCSYCEQPGHRVTTCPERRRLARAERLVSIEAWAQAHGGRL